jgi:hypothetical protein
MSETPRKLLKEISPGRFLLDEIAVSKAFAETFMLYAPEFWSPAIKEMLGRSIGVTLASVLNQIKIEGDS